MLEDVESWMKKEMRKKKKKGTGLLSQKAHETNAAKSNLNRTNAQRCRNLNKRGDRKNETKMAHNEC